VIDTSALCFLHVVSVLRFSICFLPKSEKNKLPYQIEPSHIFTSRSPISSRIHPDALKNNDYTPKIITKSTEKSPEKRVMALINCKKFTISTQVVVGKRIARKYGTFVYEEEPAKTKKKVDREDNTANNLSLIHSFSFLLLERVCI
jgi:hypothetical protein